MEDKIPLADKEKTNKQKNEKLTCLVFIMHFVCWSRCMLKSQEQAPSNRHSEHILSEAGQRIKIKSSYESEDLWIRSLHRYKLQPEFCSSFLFSIRLFIGHWLACCRAVPTDMKGKKNSRRAIFTAPRNQFCKDHYSSLFLSPFVIDFHAAIPSLLLGSTIRRGGW